MIRLRLSLVYLVLGIPVLHSATGRAAEPPRGIAALREARGLFLEGYYDRADEAYERLAADPMLRLAAMVARTDADEQRGRYSESLARLRGVETEGRRSADWNAAMGVMLNHTGEYDAACAHFRGALKLAKDHYRARFELGHLLERLGRRGEAIEVYEWFERQLRERLPERAEDLTYAGRGLYRYSVLTRHENLKERCRYILQEVFQEAFEFVDSRYWPARLAAADLMLEKHNLAEATEDYRAVLKTSGKAVGAYVGLSAAALEEWDFEGAERRAEQALEINPRSSSALLALGRARMLERKYDQAEKFAERMLKTNARDIEGLSLLAAAQARRGRTAVLEKTISRVNAIVPRCAALHQELGVWLSAARQYGEAERHFLKAIEIDPTWTEPRTELGLMYMQSGEERKSRQTLEASWNLDPFNHETYNVLELLDELERFARHETTHFVMKYDAAQDSVLVPYFDERLESLYKDVTREFGSEPAVRTIIEVFPQHSRFSVRITGRPWIHTVGASTGPVIALDAPRRTGTMSTFNWPRVLRHEFTHTVTLAATGNRIPHWMTEGLAVYAEHAPRPWSWMELLADSLRRTDLFTLQSIDWGFMRPRRATDRTRAYAQSEWMIEYVIERWGFRAIREFLRAFREGLTQEEAFRKVLGTSEDEFDAAFAAWARRQAESWGLPLDPLPNATKVRALAFMGIKDADGLASLAEVRLLDGEVEKAVELAKRALEIDARQAVALRVLCTICQAQADAEKDETERKARLTEAAPLFRRFYEARRGDPTAVACMAALAQSEEKWPRAVELWEQYRRLRPADPTSCRRLAGIYLVTQRPAEALRQLEAVFPRADDDAAVARRIARIHADAGRAEQATTWLERAIDADPYDVETHVWLGQLCEGLGRRAEALREYRAAESIRGGDEEVRKKIGRLSGVGVGTTTTRASNEQGRPEEARDVRGR